MNFFADENVIRRAIPLLQAYDIQQNTFTHLLDHFPKGTPDTEWLAAISEWTPRPIVIAGDGRILRNHVERAVLRTAGCTFIYLARGWTNTPWDEYGRKLITYWPRVRERAAQTTHQAILELTVRGQLDRRPLSA